MIDIKFNPDRYEMTVKGHDQADGASPICAGVSALFLTLVFTLDSCKKEMLVERSLRKKVQPGDAYVKCTPKDSFEPNVALIYYTILTGLKAIADENSDKVHLEVI